MDANNVGQCFQPVSFQQPIQHLLPLVAKHQLKHNFTFWKFQAQLRPAFLFCQLVAKFEDLLFVIRVIVFQMDAFGFNDEYFVEVGFIGGAGARNNEVWINPILAPPLQTVILPRKVSIPPKQLTLLLEIPRHTLLLAVQAILGEPPNESRIIESLSAAIWSSFANKPRGFGVSNVGPSGKTSLNSFLEVRLLPTSS